MFKFIFSTIIIALIICFVIHEFLEIQSYKSTQCLVTAKNIQQKKISTEHGQVNCFAPEIAMQVTVAGQVQTRILDVYNVSCSATAAQANARLNAYVLNQVYPCWYGSGELRSTKPTFTMGVFYGIIAAGFILFILFFREIYFISKFLPSLNQDNTQNNKVNPGFFATLFTGNMIYSAVIGGFVLLLLVLTSVAQMQTVQGTVVISDVAPYLGRAQCNLKTRYEVNRSTYQITETFYLYGNESCHAVGQTIPVYYDPKDPTQATAKTFMQRYLVFGSMLLLALLGLLFKWLASIAKK